MQFKADMTPDELKADNDPLFYLCHPLGKLSLMSDMIARFTYDCPSDPLINLRQSSLEAIHFIIDSAIDEIEVIQKAADAQLNDIEKFRNDLAEKLKTLMSVNNLTGEA